MDLDPFVSKMERIDRESLLAKVARETGQTALDPSQLKAATDPLRRGVGDPVPGTPGVVDHAALQTALDDLRAKRNLELN
jgi:hypothetical protein